MPDPAPLEGLLVADLSRVLAGPLASSWLADLGATVRSWLSSPAPTTHAMTREALR